MNLEAKIEAILFFKGEPISVKKLADLLEEKEIKIKEAVSILEEKLKKGGLQLIYKEDKIMLGTNSELGSFLEKLNKEELTKDLSIASLETLTIILYQPNISRSEIDYIRGVNSSFILRILSIRGLIERTFHPTDQRKYIYQPTFELLSYLGLAKIEDLPEYDNLQKILAKNKDAYEQEK